MSAYWEIRLQEALDDLSIKVTQDQLRELVESVKHIKEMEFEATGQMYIPNPLVEENKRITEKLRVEKSKVGCKVCNSTGRVQSYGGTFACDSECIRCNGEGKHLP